MAKKKVEAKTTEDTQDTWHFNMDNVLIVGPPKLKAPEMIEEIYRRAVKCGRIA